MKALDRFFEEASREGTLESAIPEGVAITFEITGPGGGYWTVYRNDRGIHVERVQHLRPDCLVRCAVDAFWSILEGSLSPTEGFMNGTVEVEGDVGLVIRMQRVVRFSA